MLDFKDMIETMPTVRASQAGEGLAVSRLCYSSREVTADSGSVFFALKGTATPRWLKWVLFTAAYVPTAIWLAVRIAS